jgi:peptidoglycan/xylan/chitin deacetylase (PgdA/CDA1 family)
MYHKVGKPPEGSQLLPLWVSSRQFRRQMAYLKDHGYASLSLSGLVSACKGKEPLPPRSVLVTFDDGYENFYTEAFPVLEEFKIKAGVFLVADTMGASNHWHDPATETPLPMLSAGQIREMRASGLVEFGSHTLTHRNLDKISLPEARKEIGESKKRLEDFLGAEVSCFAYPYGAGAYRQDLRDAVREAGYALDFGVKQGINPWPHEPSAGPLRRLFIRGDDTAFDFYLNLTRGRARF